MKVQTYTLEDLPFTIVQRNGNPVLELRNEHNILIGLLDTSTSKQTLTQEKLAALIGDRAEVLLNLLKKEGLV